MSNIFQKRENRTFEVIAGILFIVVVLLELEPLFMNLSFGNNDIFIVLNFAKIVLSLVSGALLLKYPHKKNTLAFALLGIAIVEMLQRLISFDFMLNTITAITAITAINIVLRNSNKKEVKIASWVITSVSCFALFVPDRFYLPSSSMSTILLSLFFTNLSISMPKIKDNEEDDPNRGFAIASGILLLLYGLIFLDISEWSMISVAIGVCILKYSKKKQVISILCLTALPFIIKFASYDLDASYGVKGLFIIPMIGVMLTGINMLLQSKLETIKKVLSCVAGVISVYGIFNGFILLTDIDYHLDMPAAITAIIGGITIILMNLWISPLPLRKENEPDGYYNLALHVILLILTFGVWECIWIYNTTKYLNDCENVECRNPTKKLLLCIFVPFYYIYWVYTSSQIIDVESEKKGLSSQISVVCLILSLFIRIVPSIVMQNRINSICSKTYLPKKNADVSNIGAADEIKKYKELLDNGAITDEEFKLKKKQLLGL